MTTHFSNSVDVLIDMQRKSAGLDFSERNRVQERDSRPTPAVLPERPAPPRASHPSGLFGTSVHPGETAQEQRRDDSDLQSALSRGRSSAAFLSTGGSGGGRDDAPGAANLRRWPAIQAAIRFVRENRGLVAAVAAATLALVWGASITLTQRRR